MFGKFKHVIKDKDLYGNSFSRNKNLVIDHYRVRITINKNILSNNKIIPLDGEIIHRKINIDNSYLYGIVKK